LQGTTSATAVNGIATFTNLSYSVAETMTVNFASGALAGTNSTNVVVSPAALAKMQLLVPGETAAPGTGSGKSGTPATEIAGTAFTVTVNAVDSFWNVVNTNDTVSVTSSDANAALPSNAALVSGSRTFSVTLKTAGTATVTGSDVTHASFPSSTSPSIQVVAGAFTKLQVLAPGETAAPGTASGKTGTTTSQSAGTSFTVTVNAVDANWNLVSSASDTVALSSSDIYATLPPNAALIGGTTNFDVILNTAGTRTITATDITDGSKTGGTSSLITVTPTSFPKLQLLVPGETAVPGSPTGKTGTPTAQTAGIGYNVTVNAVDANWNLVNSVTDSVGVTSTDPNDLQPPITPLVSGT